MRFIKEGIRKLLRSFGRDIVGYYPDRRGVDAFRDMKYFLRNEDNLTIFDVGANVGQSVKNFKNTFPGSEIHSFEPSPSTYRELEKNCGEFSKVHPWNRGVGAEAGTLPLFENSQDVMSSFLEPGELGWGEIEQQTEVEVVTLDDFVEEQELDYIHILKSDTQGFDFNVLKGAENLMKESRIGLIYFECIFSDQYENLPPVHEILKYVYEREYSIVNFYNPYFQQEILSWNDILLIDNAFHKQCLSTADRNA